MATNVKNQILDSLKWFKAKLTSSIVNNCSSTSTTLPLSAAQGRSLQNQITQQNTNISNLIKVKKKTVANFFVENLKAQAYTMVSLPKQDGEISPYKRIAIKVSSYSTSSIVGPVWLTIEPSSGGDWYVYIYNHYSIDVNGIYLQFEIYYI